MSEEYVCADSVIPKKTAASLRSDKTLKLLLMILAVILGAELIWLFVVTPCMPFGNIRVSGINGMPEELVFAQAGIATRTSYFNIDVRKAEASLALLPAVESARVVKQFPDRLQIELKGRTAAAVSLAMVHGRLCPVFLDKTGVVFKIGSASGKEMGDFSLPVISGLVFENVTPGTRLPAIFEKLLRDIDRINNQHPELMAAISEIRIQKKAYNGYELVLYPAHKQIRILAGSELNEDMLRYMILAVDVLSVRDPGINEIDFRTGTAVYSVKEAFSG